MLPESLVLIRHGESEGNVARHLERTNQPLDHIRTEEFVNRPGRTWTLSEKGVKQAQVIGHWLRDEADRGIFGGYHSQRHYVSPFRRAEQTAAHLGLVVHGHVQRPSVQWYKNRNIRERDWGDIETILRSEFEESEFYSNNAHKKKIDPLYWRPPGGESLADVAELRGHNFMDTLHRLSSYSAVFAVTHGEYMRAIDLLIRRASDDDYAAWDADDSQRIPNCGVIHYSRKVPEERFLRGSEKPGEHGKTVWPTRDFMTYVRRARPVCVDGHWYVEVDPWEEIEFKTYTNEELMNG